MMTFSEGLLVRYKSYIGNVRFISNQYITICIQTYDHKVRDVCLLVYPNEWKDIELVGDYEETEK